MSFFASGPPLRGRRLRIRVAESETQSLPDTQVLFRQRVAWVVLLGAFLAILCLPGHRRLFLTQVEEAWLHRVPTWASPTGDRAAAHRERLQAALRRKQDDPYWQSGAVQAGALADMTVTGSPAFPTEGGTFDPTGIRDRRLDYLEGLRRRFPEDRAILAHCLRYYTQQHLRVIRAELHDYPSVKRSQLLVRPVVERIEGYAREGTRIDPGNGYYPAVLAGAYFAAGMDEEGLDALHQASLRSTWKDHACMEGFAARDLILQAYGDHGLWMHAVPVAMVLYPHFQPIRQAARMGAWHAAEGGVRGDRQREHALRADLIRLGGLMRREADTLIGRYVGDAVRDIGFPDRKNETEYPPSEERIQARLRAYSTYLHRVRRESPEHAAPVEAELEAARRYPIREEADVFSGAWDGILARGVVRDVTGLTLLLNLGLAFVLWAAAAVGSLLLGRWMPERDQARWRRFWTEIPPGARVGTLIGLLLLLSVPYFLNPLLPLPAYLSVLGMAVVLGAVLRLLGGGRNVSWNGLQTAIFTLMALGLAAGAHYGLTHLARLDQYWEGVSPAVQLMVMSSDSAAPPFALLLAPLPAALGLSALLAALIRRASLLSAVDAARLGAKGVCAVLAAAYLVFLLWAVPAEQRDARAFDRAIQQEVAGAME
jgi:hypothetical protein